MALHFAHLAPIFPYVSDGGGKSPQAGYFSQLIDLISISSNISKSFILIKKHSFIFLYYHLQFSSPVFAVTRCLNISFI